jgi:hypothetical protein
VADLDEIQWKQIDDELASGRKIQAIKLYREHTGSDLKPAKDAVEARLSQLRSQDPQRYPPTKTGCTLMLLVAPLAYVAIKSLM